MSGLYTLLVSVAVPQSPFFYLFLFRLVGLINSIGHSAIDWDTSGVLWFTCPKQITLKTQKKQHAHPKTINTGCWTEEQIYKNRSAHQKLLLLEILTRDVSHTSPSVPETSHVMILPKQIIRIPKTTEYLYSMFMLCVVAI